MCRRIKGKVSKTLPKMVAAISVLLAGANPLLHAAAANGQVDFNRDVRRVLSENCFKCHGPDPKERKGGGKKGGLRIDTVEGSRVDLGGYAAIVPGHPEKSELIHRITTKDLDDKMTP